MTTLLAVYHNAECMGRCDAKCYDATGDECDCVCRGLNHGVGRAVAIAQTRENADRWFSEYAERRGFARSQVDELVGAAVFQEALFS